MTPPPPSGLGKWGEAGRGVTLTPLSLLPASLLPALADLHCATMPTLLTDVGRPFVLRYYQLAHTAPP